MRLILNLARCIRELRANKKSPVSTSNIYIYAHIHTGCASHTYRMCEQPSEEKISKLVNRRASGSHQQRYLSLPFLFGVLSGRRRRRGGKNEGRGKTDAIISLEFGPAAFFASFHVAAATRDIIGQPHQRLFLSPDIILDIV